MAEKKEKLFDQFPPVTTDEWRAKVDADLKGVPFEKKLVWRTNEGFNVNPMYRAEDIAGLETTKSLPGQYPYVRGTRDNNNWLTRQEILPADVAEANSVARDVITKGVNSLGFKVGEPTVDTLEKLFEGIDLAKVEINLNTCPGKALELTAALVEYLKKHDAVDKFHGSIDYDPFRPALRHGAKISDDAVATAKSIIEIASAVPALRVIGIDSVIFNNAGAYIYQELGYAMAWGASWMTGLTESGVDADVAARAIKFNIGVGSNYFMELAKIRAMRMLWAQVAHAYGASEDACKAAIHAETSKYNQTIYDAHVNLLRSQTEAMSAALAGADSITVVPFDMPYKTPDEFSQRIARNQQFLLKEESHLDKVVDPAGGSYYVETLTVSLASEAWKTMLQVEAEGGFFAAVNDGSIQKAVNETSTKRHGDMARRKEILLGTNQYPNFNEMAAGKIEKHGCGCGCSHPDANPAHALNNKRQASDFETLRLATEAASNRPKVFMLTIGNLAMRLARAQFASNFFGCAGYEIIDNIGFETVEQGVEAAKKANADVVVLCSSDDEYEVLAPETAKALDGSAILVVAGNPACTEALMSQGITNFIHVRSNVLETLEAFNAKLLK